MLVNGQQIDYSLLMLLQLLWNLLAASNAMPSVCPTRQVLDDQIRNSDKSLTRSGILPNKST
jgi:hypothetical protein